ncbi:TPA: hypothetical protein N0F65_006946 [Lagenidium giganteum]|uniref:Multiple inositol polyphosphate phosphatase 1 n=1 Tax=Lagenidium giganteum TaxID=4803 RepID=A0AAV2ZH89_9STRA|nr:TPA: hypothetical protein N0F65_006946 [Lagenidium giganteum]
MAARRQKLRRARPTASRVASAWHTARIATLLAVSCTCAILVVHLSIVTWTSEVAINAFPLAHLFATKTRYGKHHETTRLQQQRQLRATPSKVRLELVQQQLVARHGTRFPTLGNIEEIETLLGKLKPIDMSLLPPWLRNYQLPYNASEEGRLAPQGVKDLAGLAARLLQSTGARPHVFDKSRFRVAHTSKARTRNSAIAFARDYFSNPIDAIAEFTTSDMLLRYFDYCKRYDSSVKKNASAKLEWTKYKSSEAISQNLERLRSALHLPDHVATNFTVQDVEAAYSACAFDYALYHRTDQWCSLIEEPIQAVTMDYLDDLKNFYQLGGGHAINYEMAAILLQDIMREIEEAVRGASNMTAHLRFAHAETTLPLMTLLGFGSRTPLLASFRLDAIKARSFRTSKWSPFASNIEFRLLQECIDEQQGSLTSSHPRFFLQVFINEHPEKIPGCSDMLCDIDTVRQLWQRYLEGYDFQKECHITETD